MRRKNISDEEMLLIGIAEIVMFKVLELWIDFETQILGSRTHGDCFHTVILFNIEFYLQRILHSNYTSRIIKLR